eukprot:Pompholyxophrys_punicea_v1_NODE_1381_length_749_cov_5.442363.p1 type:complete len:108 gc:universal NODE_1381_length_749_cov_5.442363:164-487(+)
MKNQFEHIIEGKGHRVLFLPKYHCELASMERVWCHIKYFVRQECDYTYPSLKEHVPKCLDKIDVDMIRKFFRKSRDYGRAYSNGATCTSVETEVKKFKSHRRVHLSQ